jgi:hypothetical protein
MPLIIASVAFLLLVCILALVLADFFRRRKRLRNLLGSGALVHWQYPADQWHLWAEQETAAFARQEVHSFEGWLVRLDSRIRCRHMLRQEDGEVWIGMEGLYDSLRRFLLFRDRFRWLVRVETAPHPLGRALRLTIFSAMPDTSGYISSFTDWVIPAPLGKENEAEAVVARLRDLTASIPAWMQDHLRQRDRDS